MVVRISRRQAPDLDSDELDERLERWALWARGPSIGSVSTAEGYLKERLDMAADSAEMTDEIMVTERAIARTKMEDKAYWRVISRWYLGRLSFIEISLFFHTPEDGIKQFRADQRLGRPLAGLEGNRGEIFRH